MEGIDLLTQAKAAGLTVEAHGSELVIKGPKRAKSVAMKLIERKAAVLAALDATMAKSITTRNQTPREKVVQGKPASRRAVELQGTKYKTITIGDKTYALQQLHGMWFFQLDGHPEAGWTCCSPKLLEFIEETNGIAVHGTRPTRQ
jgi:hypothetical protein